MMKILKDMAVLVNKAGDAEDMEELEYNLRDAAYQLQARQFLYRNKGRHRVCYETVVKYQDYFLSLMDAFNHDLEINEERGYVGILPRILARRLSLDKTLLLFTLRYIYDQELMAFNADDNGSVKITLDDFEMRCNQFTRRVIAKSASELKNLMEPLIHAGVVEIGLDEDKPEIYRLKINPSITALLSGDMLKRVEVYMRAEDIDTQPEEDDEEQSEETA
jgi:hypothetical protein